MGISLLNQYQLILTSCCFKNNRASLLLIPHLLADTSNPNAKLHHCTREKTKIKSHLGTRKGILVFCYSYHLGQSEVSVAQFLDITAISRNKKIEKRNRVSESWIIICNWRLNQRSHRILIFDCYE